MWCTIKIKVDKGTKNNSLSIDHLKFLYCTLSEFKIVSINKYVRDLRDVTSRQLPSDLSRTRATSN